jgi:glycosyltransferase involved in cell wall biosynthesis
MRSPVAVIIPAHNAASVVGDAIRSVQEQTLRVAEILVVDDGSTDGTARAAEQQGARVLRQQNQGVSAARNAGIRATTEPWIAFLDADDVWYPEKIERQWAAIERYQDTGFVSCDLCWFDGHAPLHAEREPDASVTWFASAPAVFLANEMSYMPSAAVVRREAILTAGLFDESLRHNEDFDCFLRVLRDWPLAVVRRPLVGIRMLAGSASKDQLKMVRSFIEVVERTRTFPERYPPGTAQAYEPALRDALYKAGHILLDRDKRREARALFACGFRLRASPRAAWYWGVSWLGAQDRE